MRLTMWQRLSLVCSLAWLIPAGTYFSVANALEIAHQNKSIIKVCADAPRTDYWTNCENNLRDQNGTIRDGYFVTPAIYTLVPFVAAWLIFAVLMISIRFVRNGETK